MVNRRAYPAFAIVRGAFSARVYAQMVTRYGARYMLFCTIGFGVMWAGMWFAAGAIAAVYFADRPLLDGAHIVGEVLELDVRPYTTKGRVEYPTAVTYTFTTPDGRGFTNFIRRALVSPPGLQRGGPIDVLYEPGNPGHSTIAKEFASDMAQKPFGAWLFLFLGVYPALYVYRYLRWRREGARPLTLRLFYEKAERVPSDLSPEGRGQNGRASRAHSG